MGRWIVLVAVLASSLLAGCIPPPPDDDVIVSYDPEETVMGEIQERGELIVGIPKGREPFGRFTSGFGELVADALGVSTRFEAMPPQQLLTAPDEGVVDISFPLITITEKLVRRFAFTDPIYVAHQRLLVREGSAVEQVDDLSGTVCQFITRETHRIKRKPPEPDEFYATPVGVNVKELNQKVVVVEPPEVTGCLRDLEKGTVEAITAADWLLYPALLPRAGLEIVGDDLTTEAYGAVVESEASAWTDLVNGVLAEAQAEGDWDRIYSASFRDLAGENVTIPDMTVEEAAALYPSDL